ncbi:MAG: phosphoenolpyruvate synthase, partial [Candidatus Aenigmatarchaeota archaeon]
MSNVVWFQDVNSEDVDLVGGKNASLGEMINEMNVPIPPGFATTSEAYELFMEQADIEEEIRNIIESRDVDDVNQLKEAGSRVRELIRNSDIPEELKKDIKHKYRELGEKLGEEDPNVAVRSSATAEDLPTASFAGQQETYLNVSGLEDLYDSIKKCIASLFTDRAIHYREDKGFDHFKVKLSVGVQEMVNSLSSGVLFTIDPDSGFEKVVFINGGWGLGELVVRGDINPDEYVYFKPTHKMIYRELGEKEKEIVREDGKNVEREVEEERRNEFVLSEDEVEELSEYAIKIEEHYGKSMDIEWAKDRRNNRLYILQARPETVHSQEDKNLIKTYRLKEQGKVLTRGQSIGRMIDSGEANVIMDAENIDRFEEGQVLVTDMTDPDWEPIMKKASAIITEKGGSTSHAAIVSRELGMPAVVGTGDASSVMETGQNVTVDCTGEDGKVLDGKLGFEVIEENVEEIPDTETDVMMNISVPGQAFDLGQY